MTPTILDQEILERFEAALRSVGAGITQTWAPGLSNDAIDQLCAPAGIDLPEEARRWWRWHNGCPADTSPAMTELIPDRSLLTLADVVELYVANKDVVHDVHGVWAHLQPLTDQPWILFDCSGRRDDPVPVAVGQHGEGQRVVLPSIGELVTVWIDLIDTGAFATDPDGTWQWDFDKLPPDVQELGVY